MVFLFGEKRDDGGSKRDVMGRPQHQVDVCEREISGRDLMGCRDSVELQSRIICATGRKRASEGVGGCGFIGTPKRARDLQCMMGAEN